LVRLEESGVEVVHERITLVNGVANDVLDTLRLQPRLTIGKVVKVIRVGGGQVVVSSHEGIEDTKLIELNKEIVTWNAVESGQVTASKYNAGDT
jgi:hypothetical protein